MGEVICMRRYCLLKWKQQKGYASDAVAAVWRAKQLALLATPLPETVPFQTQLFAAGYHALEDVRGADVDELTSAGLSMREAEQVLAALE